MARFEYLDTEAINVEEGIRQIIDKEPLDELVTSIKQHGILQPIVVETVEEGKYKLQIGSRRVAAARIIGLEKVPALILDDQLEAEKSIAIMLVENLHREDLDPIDEAEAYATLKDMGTKVSAIARLVGKERTYVSHSLRLLRLHPRVREAVRQRTIPTGARVIPSKAGALPSDRPDGRGHGKRPHDAGDEGKGNGALG